MLPAATDLRKPRGLAGLQSAGNGNLGERGDGAEVDYRQVSEYTRIRDRPHYRRPPSWSHGTRGAGALGASQGDGVANRDLRPRRQRSRSDEASPAPLLGLRPA